MVRAPSFQNPEVVQNGAAPRAASEIDAHDQQRLRMGGDAPDPTRWRISRRSCPPRHSGQDPPGPRIIRFCARAGKTPAAPALDVRGRRAFVCKRRPGTLHTSD